MNGVFILQNVIVASTILHNVVVDAMFEKAN